MSNELCPNEVLHKIFSHLKFYALIEIASYNQELYTLIFTKHVLQSERLLTLSAKYNCLSIFKILYDNNPYIVITGDQTTYLHIACKSKSKNIVKFLLHQKVDPNIECFSEYRKPLCVATYYKQFDICKLLVEAGAHINSCETYTPLYHACFSNNEKLIRYFIKHGAEPNLYCRGFHDSLEQLCRHNNLQMLQFMIRHGANYVRNNLLFNCSLEIFEYLLTLDLPTEYLEEALVILSRRKKLEFVKLLLKNKVNVNCIHDYTTPLYNAVSDSNFPMCELLLKSKAEPNFVVGSYSPLQLAVYFENYYIVKLLLRYGGDPNIGTNGRSCYDICPDFNSEYGYRKKRRIE